MPDTAPTVRRKLIEVALPLEAINRESAREKSIRHGHPSTLHLWWARRPLAAARAVLFAQLVDDPSSRPEEFPTEELQRAERERLHRLIERLVVWENIRDEKLFAEARAEILKSTDGNPPPILDPFAGGGTIPLEAKRLGLSALANDLNPLAVLINTVLLEMVDRFSIELPVSGGLPQSPAEALATDLLHYATLLERRVSESVGHLYPRANDRSEPLAYFWARTVACPNPACGVQVPLAGSWTAGARKGGTAYFVPTYNPVENSFDVQIRTEAGIEPPPTINRHGGRCPMCDARFSLDYVKAEGVAGRLGARLLALQVRDGRLRRFVASDPLQRAAAASGTPIDVEFLNQEMSRHSQYMAPPRYGMTKFRDLFLDRQLVALENFVRELDSVEEMVLTDAREAGLPSDERRYAAGGSGARAYSEAIRILLALSIGRLVNRQSTLCIWNSSALKVEQVFARQAYSMTWLFAEANPFAGASGSFSGQVEFLAKAVAAVPRGYGAVSQGPAQRIQAPNPVVVSTDPPYYDNVPYADLSDFFIVWHRRMLNSTLPFFRTLLSPKSEELVADHVRWDGRDAARIHFEHGFKKVFEILHKAHSTDAPMAVYYAFRQADSSVDGATSTGWEAVLNALIESGWLINGTWPMRTERGGGLRSLGRNALASSVVIVCRPRDSVAGSIDRRNFIAALRREMPSALRNLQQGLIAPVDFPQATIGPGMAVFSRYQKVFEADGSVMSVRSALARISEIRDQLLNAQEGDFETTSRFAIAWYRQHGYGVGRFGDADNMARAYNISVEVISRSGVLTNRANSVQLIKPADLSPSYDALNDSHTSTWEVLHHLIRTLEHDGIPPAGELLRDALRRPDAAIDADLVKELAHLLFRIAEDNKWTKDALSFNNLVTSWPEVLDAARAPGHPRMTQGALDFDGEDDQ